MLGAVAVLAAGTVVGTASPVGAVGSWSTPVDLSVPTERRASDPQITASADGLHLAAVWEGWPGDGEIDGVVQVATSGNGGASWTAPHDLTDVAGQGANPQIAGSVDGTHLTAVWHTGDASTADIRAARSSDGGESWSIPVTVSPTGQYCYEPQVAASGDGSHLVAVWLRADGSTGNYVVQSRASVDGGATWSTPVDLSAAGGGADLAQIVASTVGGRFTAVWQRWNGSHHIVQAVTSSDDGVTWGTPVNLSAAGGNAAAPQLTTSTDGGRVAAVWQRFDGVNWRVQAATSGTAGATWGNAVDLSPTGLPANFAAGDPQIAGSGDGNRLAVVWSRYDGTRQIVSTAVSGDGGTTWSAPVDLSTAGQYAYTPQVATSGDGLRVAVTWRRYDGSNDVTQATTSSNGGATWGTPVTLSATGKNAQTQQITSSVDGTRLAVVWDRDGVIQAATGGNGGPGVVGVWPVSGPDAGGTVVSLSGTGLTGASGVVFGGGAASSVTVVSDTQLTAVTPPHPAGAVDVTVVTPLGSATLPGGFTFTATPPPPPVPPVVPPPVDVTAPTAVMARPTAGVTLSSAVPVSWSGRDVGGAVAWYQVQRAVKAPGAALGGYRDWGGARTATSATMTGARPGFGYCFRVRAVDTTGNVSAWSAPRCSTMAGDDRVLAGRVGWSRPVVRTAYLRTVTTSRTRGAVLVLARSRGSSLALVVTTTPGGGVIGVYVKGRRVAVVPTTARRTTLKVIVAVKVRTTGLPVVLRVEAPGTRGVTIDGITQLP